MSNPAYVKSEPGKWASEGVRVADTGEILLFDEETQIKIQTIIEAMQWPQLIWFHYGESDRVVAPVVIGVSSKGNPLMRGWQQEGVSRSGKGAGWRVFQIYKMENVQNFQDFFNIEDLDFVREYPWLYEVFFML